MSPRACFVWYTGNEHKWAPIPGTGCAHYVAHTLGMRGTSGVCDEGYVFRVPALVAGMSQVASTSVQTGDVWTNEGLSHTGLVSAVVASESGPPRITITHCSSAQHGVVTNDWATHFSSGGRFYRPASSTRNAGPVNTRTAIASQFPAKEWLV